MANNAANTLLIVGSPELITSLKAAIDTDAQKIDFSAIMPVPAELKNTSAPVEIVEDPAEAARINLEWNARLGTGPDTKVRAVTREQAARLMRQYGAVDWQQWTQTNWNATRLNGDVTVYRATSTAIMCSFDTAWSAPTTLLDHLHHSRGAQIIGATVTDGDDEIELHLLLDPLEGVSTERSLYLDELVFDHFFTIHSQVEDAGTETEYRYSWVQYNGDITELLARPKLTLDSLRELRNNLP